MALTKRRGSASKAPKKKATVTGTPKPKETSEEKAARQEAGKKARMDALAKARAVRDAANAEAKAAREIKEAAAVKEMSKHVKEINTRLEKAATADKQSDNHRIAAAIRLGEAKKTAEEAGVSFKTWCEEHINFVEYGSSYRNMLRLAAIGQAPDPVQALADLRDNTKQDVAKHRAKQKAAQLTDSRSKGKGSKPSSPVESALAAFDRMDEKDAPKLLESVASSYGMTISKSGETKESNIALAGLAAMRSAFQRLDPTERLEFVKWALDEFGLDFDFPEDVDGKTKTDAEFDTGDDGLEIPPALKRRKQPA